MHFRVDISSISLLQLFDECLQSSSCVGFSDFKLGIFPCIYIHNCATIIGTRSNIGPCRMRLLLATPQVAFLLFFYLSHFSSHLCFCTSVSSAHKYSLSTPDLDYLFPKGREFGYTCAYIASNWHLCKSARSLL